MSTISASQLNELISKNPHTPLCDVREGFEYRAVHVPQARNMPLSTFDPAAVKTSFAGAGTADDRPLYVICRSGARSAQACEKLRAAGYSNVVNVEGGTSGWEKAGFAVERGKAAMSVDRQTRIVIGSGVLVGALLGFFVHPAFHWVSAFFGAGLIFAGVTDTCALAFMIARAPWNRSSDDNSAVSCAPKSGNATLGGS